MKISLLSGEFPTMKRLMMVGLLAAAFGFLAARPGYAGIVSVTTSGAGGTVHNLAIDTLVNFHDAVGFYADFTSQGGIDVNVTVDGPGIYYVGYVNITNDTTSTFSTFYAYLLAEPPGSVIGLTSYSGGTFGGGPTYTPPDAPTSVAFNGPPGIGVGDSTSLYVGVYIPPADTGTQSFQVLLTPTAVPEPSSIVLGLIGALASIGVGPLRVRRKR
jgi:hypothetical protein